MTLNYEAAKPKKRLLRKKRDAEAGGERRQS